MTWSYNGDPGSSDVAKYRFLIGDTDNTQPVLQDEEITFVLTHSTNENVRLHKLFDAAATRFAREYKRSLGPQDEDPTDRLRYFEEKAKYYRGLINASGISMSKSSPSIFSKGMHDNV